MGSNSAFNSLNARINPIFNLLAVLGAHHILHVSRVRFKVLMVYSTRLSNEIKIDFVADFISQEKKKTFKLR